MAKTYECITPELRDFIERQPLFFVATAPLSRDGHVNLSPKGYDTLRVLDERTVAYLDLTGSGNETSAHLLENGRITFLWCAFSGPPRILRLYGRGETVLPEDGRWAELSALFPALPGTRQIILAGITRVQTSCGYGVPEMELSRERPTLIRWAEQKGEATLEESRRHRNVESIDGLPTALAGRIPRGR